MSGEDRVNAALERARVVLTEGMAREAALRELYAALTLEELPPSEVVPVDERLRQIADMLESADNLIELETLAERAIPELREIADGLAEPTLAMWERLHARRPERAAAIADLFRGELEQLRHEPGSTNYRELRAAIADSE